MSTAVITTDHDEIRRWAEARGGRPAVAGDPLNRGPGGILRIDFDGDGGDDDDARLMDVPWEEFFRIFERNGLAFLTQEGGPDERFNKFVERA